MNLVKNQFTPMQYLQVRRGIKRRTCSLWSTGPLKVSFILIKSLYLTSGRGSLLLAFPVLGDYVRHQEDLLEGAQDLFELHKAGSLRVQIGNKVCTTTPYPAILLS